jgi:hypothetical protein
LHIPPRLEIPEVPDKRLLGNVCFIIELERTVERIGINQYAQEQHHCQSTGGRERQERTSRESFFGNCGYWLAFFHANLSDNSRKISRFIQKKKYRAPASKIQFP